MKKTEALFWEKNELKVEEGVYSRIIRYPGSHQAPPPNPPNLPLLFEHHFQARKKRYFSLFSSHFSLLEGDDATPPRYEPPSSGLPSFSSGLERLEEVEVGSIEGGLALFSFLRFYLVLGERIAGATQEPPSPSPSPSSWGTFWSSFWAPSYVSGVRELETTLDLLLEKWGGEEEWELLREKVQKVMGEVIEREVRFLRCFDSLLPALPLVPTSYSAVEMVVDFDGTITTEQTTSLLPLLSLLKRGRSREEAEEEWAKMGENYFALYDKFFSTALAPPSSSPSSPCTIFEFLAQYDEFEDGAYTPVEDSLCLSHLTLQDIKDSALAFHHNNMATPPHHDPIPTSNSIRPGCTDGLKKMVEQSTSLSIISLNWSQEFVSEVISLSFFPSSPLPSQVRVLSNGLFPSFPPPSPSTGKLIRRVTTSKEKVVFSSNPTSLKITIGDSLNDLSALLSSDVGIVLKNHQTQQLSRSFSRVCSTFRVSLRPLFACTFPSVSSPSPLPSPSPPLREHIIFVAENWWELCIWWEEWQKSSRQTL